jgi:hypothetical protein
MNKYLPRQSSAADWGATVELTDDDGAALWDAVPDDLIVTMTVVPERRSESGTPSITATSDDANGFVTADASGLVLIAVPADTMSELAPDHYGVDRRFLVFIKIEMTDDDSTTQGPTLILPVYKGQ